MRSKEYLSGLPSPRHSVLGTRYSLLLSPHSLLRPSHIRPGRSLDVPRTKNARHHRHTGSSRLQHRSHILRPHSSNGDTGTPSGLSNDLPKPVDAQGWPRIELGRAAIERPDPPVVGALLPSPPLRVDPTEAPMISPWREEPPRHRDRHVVGTQMHPASCGAGHVGTVVHDEWHPKSRLEAAGPDRAELAATPA